MDEKTLTNVANTLKVDVETLRSRATTVLSEQGDAWKQVGKSDSDCGILAIRVAARMMTSENARLRRSGATVYEGMFISSPRPKEWGKILYNKMRNQLMNASQDVKQTLVDSGAVVLFDDNHDGTYSKFAKEEFGGDSDVTSLPKHTMKLDENTHFFVVWDKTNRTFPSGDVNFKFGNPRPQDERERSSLFLGKVQGSSGSVSLITVKAQGKAADVQYPTFVTGTIPLGQGKNNYAYAKPVISTLTVDNSLVSLYDNPPQLMIGEIIGEENVLGGLQDMDAYYDKHNGQKDWWDRQLSVITEVIHIDPREAGGLVLVCADLDISSTASTVDVYISAEDEKSIDFGVGTKMMLVGQTWRSKEGEQKLSVNGWFAFDEIELVKADVSSEVENGWDA